MDQIPASRSLGCLVVPKEVWSKAGALARSTLAVEDVDAVVKAMAANACLRSRDSSARIYLLFALLRNDAALRDQLQLSE